MPYNRPGSGVYVTNGATAIQNGDPAIRNGQVGVAVKQAEPSVTGAFSARATIAASEPFFLITKGIVVTPDPGSAPAGTPLYINTTTFVIQVSPTGGAKFGRVADVAGVRGTPTGKLRVDLDAKDSF